MLVILFLPFLSKFRFTRKHIEDLASNAKYVHNRLQQSMLWKSMEKHTAMRMHRTRVKKTAKIAKKVAKARHNHHEHWHKLSNWYIQWNHLFVYVFCQFRCFYYITQFANKMQRRFYRKHWLSTVFRVIYNLQLYARF